VDTTYKRIRSLGELLHRWNLSWQAQAGTYAETQATSAWCAKTMTFFVQDWPTATAKSMAEVRKKQFIPKEKIRSPFAILPGYLRALGPHQGLGWWNYGENSHHDVLHLRNEMIKDERFAKNCEFKRFSKTKEVRCLLYNFDTDQFTPQDVKNHVIRMGLDIVDELEFRMDGSNPLLDVRVSCMTSYLWKLLELRSGFIGAFNFSIQLAVGIDDGSAGLHGWGSFSHDGRNNLTAEQIPGDLERHLRECGVEALVLPQTLEND
jgi:hypothetical protein